MSTESHAVNPPPNVNGGGNLAFGSGGVIFTVNSAANIVSPTTALTQPVAPQYVMSIPVLTGSSLAPATQTASSLPVSSEVYGMSSLPQPTTAVDLSPTPASDLSAASSYATPSMDPASSVVPSAVFTSVSLVSGLSTESALAESTMSSQLAAASPSVASEDISTDDTSHHAPFYIAIIIGTIVVIGFLAAIIAWIVRLRMHARRRREAPSVPWANPNDNGDLEEAHEATFIGQPINRTGSKDISSQDAIPWEPRGDRDVGEPKRSPSYVRSSIHSSRASDPFEEIQHHPVIPESVAYPLPLYHAYATRNKSYSDCNGSLDGHSSASTLGPLQVANMAPGDASTASSRAPSPISANASGQHERGTSRENHPRSGPRFLGLDNSLRPSAFTRRPSIPNRRAGGSGDWEQLPMPGETTLDSRMTADDDSWTASLRSNLTYAFNAVAANLPNGPSLVRGKGQGDQGILTPKPSRGSSRRYIDFQEKSPSRSQSILSSRPWSLEERDDGTGTVHFHDHGLEDNGYGYGNPQILGSCATLGVPSTGTSIYRTSTHDSSTPLITRPPQSALLRPDEYSRGPQSGGSYRQSSLRSCISRASSVYSTMSGVSSASPLPAHAPRLPAFSRQSTMKIGALHRVDEKKEDDRSHRLERPGLLVTRSSSSGCSFSSYYRNIDGLPVDGTEVVEAEMTGQQALTDRRKKLRRVA